MKDLNLIDLLIVSCYNRRRNPPFFMTIKTHTVEKKNSKNNQEWSWEETPEVLAALEQLRKSEEATND